ncbi:hypothetical protein T492DRAFT_973350 [Pavlovales sp. CCMP2436]|nr:hypothetical protein T492DRAFT_973350 [Pavlovales sp. CCMP2436]
MTAIYIHMSSYIRVCMCVSVCIFHSSHLPFARPKRVTFSFHFILWLLRFMINMT